MNSEAATTPILASMTSLTAFGLSNMAIIEQSLRISSLIIGIFAGLLGIVVAIRNLMK